MKRHRPRRRFIAGAVCPECRAIDRIVVEEHDSGRRRRCVSCGYLDEAADPGGPRRPRPDDIVRAVRIIDPGKDG